MRKKFPLAGVFFRVALGTDFDEETMR